MSRKCCIFTVMNCWIISSSYWYHISLIQPQHLGTELKMHGTFMCSHLHVYVSIWKHIHQFIYVSLWKSSTVLLFFLQRKSSASAPGLSRSGTILLELKRHLVSQRLDELKVTLDLMRRRQQHDSKLKDGAGGRTQSDSSITQQGESELVSTSDGCNSAMDQQGYKTSAD